MRFTQWLFSILLCTQGLTLHAGQVAKVRGNQLVVKGAGSETFALDQTLCVWRADKKMGCGKVTKTKGSQIALVQMSGSPDVAVGDTAREPGRDLASTDGESSLDVKRNYKSNIQLGVELAGAGLIYSVFGSYRFAENWAANLGFSYLSVSGSADTTTGTVSASASLLQFPLSVSWLLGGPNSFFEVLAGPDIAMVSASASVSSLDFGDSAGGGATKLIFETGVGYRYWPADGGFHFRAMLYGLIANKFAPWFGLSLGYAF